MSFAERETDEQHRQQAAAAVAAALVCTNCFVRSRDDLLHFSSAVVQRFNLVTSDVGRETNEKKVRPEQESFMTLATRRLRAHRAAAGGGGGDAVMGQGISQKEHAGWDLPLTSSKDVMEEGCVWGREDV
jgi:hypothetical protein